MAKRAAKNTLEPLEIVSNAILGQQLGQVEVFPCTIDGQAKWLMVVAHTEIGEDVYWNAISPGSNQRRQGLDMNFKLATIDPASRDTPKLRLLPHAAANSIFDLYSDLPLAECQWLGEAELYGPAAASKAECSLLYRKYMASLLKHNVGQQVYDKILSDLPHGEEGSKDAAMRSKPGVQTPKPASNTATASNRSGGHYEFSPDEKTKHAAFFAQYPDLELPHEVWEAFEGDFRKFDLSSFTMQSVVQDAWKYCVGKNLSRDPPPAAVLATILQEKRSGKHMRCSYTVSYVNWLCGTPEADVITHLPNTSDNDQVRDIEFPARDPTSFSSTLQGVDTKAASKRSMSSESITPAHKKPASKRSISPSPAAPAPKRAHTSEERPRLPGGLSKREICLRLLAAYERYGL